MGNIFHTLIGIFRRRTATVEAQHRGQREGRCKERGAEPMRGEGSTMPLGATAPSGRLEALDAMRGLAALMVLFQHLAEGVIKMHTLPPPVEQVGRVLLGDTFNFGRFGVALFFLISGFVIPFSVRSGRPLSAFAVGRLFRLYPAYWLSLVFALLVLHATGKPAPSAVTIITNLTMMQKYLGQPDIVAAYWTLATEMAFYALVALLAIGGLLRAPRVLACGSFVLFVVALALALGSPLLGRRLPGDLPLHLGLMLLGTVLRLALLEGDPTARKLARLVALAFLGVAPVVQFITLPPANADGFTHPLAPTLGYVGALLLFLAMAGRRQQFGRAAIWFGSISYSLYLFHGTIITALSTLLVAGDIGRAALYIAVGTLGSVAVAVLIYYCVERPMVQLGHRLIVMGNPA